MSSVAAPSRSAVESQFQRYVRAFNTHEWANYSSFYADDVFLHAPGCPPMSGKKQVKQLFESGLNFFIETIHPTYLIIGDKAIAMEAKVHVKILKDMEFVFPFTGIKYDQGDEFVYEFVVHYELDENMLIKTFRGYSMVLNPDKGAGIHEEVLEGYEPLPAV